MSYSVFADTIADMTWPEVEGAASRGAPLLVPVAVIEQHGHHLPLATDTYGAHLLCTLAKAELGRMGIEVLIAPPYYFGLNTTTRMFPGSLDVKTETMIAVLTDISRNYASWGFGRILFVNHHGDPQHNRAIVRTIQALRAEGIRATYVVGGLVQEFIDGAYEAQFNESLPLHGDAIVRAQDSADTVAFREKVTRSRLPFDVHAGERETSLAMRWYPELLNGEMNLEAIPPVPETLRQFHEAEADGGWRELSPMGHIGDPAVASVENGELYAFEAADIARAIAGLLRS